MSPGDFYSAVYSAARDLGANDVQARLAAAQASQETGFGQHYVGGNLFGVKASEDYAGDSVTAGTNEEYNGQMVRENAKFRAYENPLDSVKDYLATIQSNFPEAWNASTFSEAVEGLNNGVYGKYATDSQYGKKISTIDKNYGGFSYAANPANVPTPYGPNDEAPAYAVADDVIPAAETNFAPIDPSLAYAANPVNVPVPEFAQPADLLSAYAPTQTEETPFSAALNERVAVAPVPTPTVEGWSDLASAKPVMSPLGSVQAQADISGVPALDAAARAVPTMNLPAFADLGTPPGFIASATVPEGIAPQEQPSTSLSGFQDLANAGPLGGQFATPSSRMGLAEPSFDTSRFDGMAPSIASLDASRFASSPTTSRIGVTQTLNDMARMDPMAGLINPATNTQSFITDPAATGIYSPEHQALQAQAEANLQRELAARPAFSLPATGVLSTNQPLAAQATVPAATQSMALAANPALATPNFAQAVTPSVPGLNTFGTLSSAYAADQATPPAQQAISDAVAPAMTPAQIGAYQQFAETATPGGITNLSGNTLIGPTGVATPNFAAPAVETVTAMDRPATSTIDGPTTVSAIDQQKQAVATPAVSPAISATPTTATQRSTLGGMLNKGTIGGGLIGALAAGPMGGVIGALIGNQIAKGGITNPFSGGGFVAPTTQIGGGVSNIAGIYGGAFAPGTYATANNGTTVTAQPGGWSLTTNRYGVTEAVSPTGQISSYFGSTPTSPAADQDQDTAI